MTDHYYSQNPTTPHDEKNIRSNFFQYEFIFITDAGVFSKSRVDFGTTLLIDSLQLKERAKVLDLGCGYGPIGIVIASQISAGEVQLADINERAIGLTEKNIQLNKKLLNEKVSLKLFQSDGFDKIEDKDFDYIILNPPIRTGKENVYQMFEEAYQHLKEGGEFWIVIQKKQGADSALKKLESIFQEVEQIERKKGYQIIKSTKK